MFDLEQAITDWRKKMLAAGIKTPVPLDELESHLRDDTEQQVLSGVDLQQAFNAAVQRIGQASALESEFKKTCGVRCKINSWGQRFWRQLVWQGGGGLVVTVILNLAGLFVFHKSSCVFFSDKWWTEWFPNYIVWMSFLIIGLAEYDGQRKAANR